MSVHTIICAYLAKRLFIAFNGIIDLLAILPYYIEIIMQQDTVCASPQLGRPSLLIPVSVSILQVLDPPGIPPLTGLPTFPVKQHYSIVRV